MNRKLRNTILAFSVTGVMLAVGLMAAHPVQPDTAMPAAGAIVLATAPGAAQPAAPAAPARHPVHAENAATGDAASARIEAHSRRFEAEMEKVASVEEAVAATAGFVAAVTTEAVLLETLSRGADDARPEAEAAPEESRKRRSGGVRSAIAVPYFSFARGMGRGDRS